MTEGVAFLIAVFLALALQAKRTSWARRTRSEGSQCDSLSGESCRLHKNKRAQMTEALTSWLTEDSLVESSKAVRCCRQPAWLSLRRADSIAGVSTSIFEAMASPPVSTESPAASTSTSTPAPAASSTSAPRKYTVYKPAGPPAPLREASLSSKSGARH